MMMSGGDAITAEALMNFTAPSQSASVQQHVTCGGDRLAADKPGHGTASQGSPQSAPDMAQQNQKSDYAQFCDMLRHPSAQPVVAKTKDFVQRFQMGLPREQAAAKVHQFLSAVEQWMMTEIVVFAAEADEAGRANAAEGMEKLLLSRLHPKVFATDAADVADDEMLYKRMCGLTWVTLKSLGVPPADDSLLPRAIEELKSIDQYKAPRDKMVCVMNACKVIQDMLKRTWAGQQTKPGIRALSADDFLPLLIYIVIKANPPRFHSNVEYIAAFRHPDRLGGEDMYFLTTLMSAKEFIKEAGPDTLDVSPDEYKQLYASSLAAAGFAVSLASAPAEKARNSPSSTAAKNDARTIQSQDLLDMTSDVAPSRPAQPAIVSRSTPTAAAPSQLAQPASASRSASVVEDAEDDEDFERTLFNVREVMVYQIPPASSSLGYKVDDWKKCVWKGCCRVVGKGKTLTIKLIDVSSGKLFAQCVAADGDYQKAVEAVTDSSRYFVLKVSHGQKHAFIGMGFEDRNDAFDFKCTLSDFKDMGVREQEVGKQSQQAPAQSKDLSLKEGAKITMKLKGVSATKRESKPVAASQVFAVAPPPAFTPLAKPPTATQQPAVAQAAPIAADWDAFDDFGAFQTSSPPAVSQATQQAAGLADDFGSIDFMSAPPAQPSAPSDAVQFDSFEFQNAPPAAQVEAPTSVAPSMPSQQKVQFDSFEFQNAPPAAQVAAPTSVAPSMPSQQKVADPFDFGGLGESASSASATGNAGLNVPTPSVAAQPQWQGGYHQAAATSHAAPPPGANSYDALQTPVKSDPFGDFDIRGLTAMQVTVS